MSGGFLYNGKFSFIGEGKKSVDMLIEKYIPRQVSEDSLMTLFGKPHYEYDVASIQKAIADPVWNFLDRGGKRWRPALFLLIVEALGKNPQDYEEFALIPELIHNGTIIVDDIEDNSSMRRGKPALHKIYGTDVSINAGNMLYFLPLLSLIRDSLEDDVKLAAFRVYAEEMVNLHIGQSMDINWHRGESERITEKQYLQMCAFKTGTLARMAARLAVVLCQKGERMEKGLGCMAETIGIAFQIQDDILDVTLADRKKFGKSWGNDIREGKRSFMVVHVLECGSRKDRRRLLEILDAPRKRMRDIREAIAILQKYDSIDYAKSHARSLVSSGWDDVEGLLDDSDAKKHLHSFVNYLVEREF